MSESDDQEQNGQEQTKRTGQTINQNRQTVKISDIQTKTDSDLSDTVKPVHQCPECGKTFDNPRSLSMHRLRKHGVKPDFLDSGKRESPKRPSRESKPQYISPIGETGVPDALTLLRNQLILYGVPSKDADAVADYMKSYNVDDLFALSRALDDIGMPRNRKRMFLQSWINARDIPVDRKLAERLGLIEPSYPDWRHTFHYGYYDEPSERKQFSEMPALVNAIANLIKSLRNEAPPPPNTVDPLVTSLQEQVIDLRKQLEQEKEKRLLDTLENLKNEVREIKNSQSRIANQFSVWEAGIRELASIIKEYFNLGKVALMSSKEKPQIKERVGESGTILKYIPQELIEEAA
ncbi:MAG: hypothetical protein DRO12_04370 [Thermoprotei archaeon]|nr:MAG: hypothetical protein DRO12_04370 [Thermoprotei archaeon]